MIAAAEVYRRQAKAVENRPNGSMVRRKGRLPDLSVDFLTDEQA